jgi:small subunit ribosomal protein S18
MDLERANRIVKPRPRTKVSPRGPSARVSAEQDPFRQLGIDPLREVNNPVLLNHFVSDMGKIQGRGKTGLTWWSQRKMGKAIRRARNMGIIPILSRYRHPYSR